MSSNLLTFNGCNCSYEFNKNGGIHVDPFNLPDCAKTWDLLAAGLNIGVFQCESFQMQQMTKKFKPRSLEDLSAVVAAVRPGVSEVVLPDGTNAIDRYLQVKNGEHTPTYMCPELEPILAPTHSIILYQEQILDIAKVIAGFTLTEADLLRKGIGKKDTAIVAQCRIQFLEGAAKIGILNAEDAATLFDQIEKSARYSFNKAHSWAYADTAYSTAYLKAHFPKTFMTSSLFHARTDSKPLDEVKKVVQDARKFNIEVLQPDLKLFQPTTDILAGKIRFGLSDVKNVSETAAKNMQEVAAAGELVLGKPFAKWNWLEFLIFFSTSQTKLKSGINYTPNSTSIISLIKVGAISYGDMYRQEMLFEYERVWKKLSNGQRDWIRNNYNPKWKDLYAAVAAVAPLKKDGGGSHDKEGENKARDLLKLMKNRPADIRDTAKLVADDERLGLGIAISCGALDDNKFKGVCNTTCKEFLSGVSRPSYRLIGEIKRLKAIVCKNGRKMAFLVLDDNTIELESVTVFPDEFERFEHLLYEGGIVYIEGTKDRNRGGLIVKKVHPA